MSVRIACVLSIDPFVQPESITGLLGASRVFMLTKQAPKARNLLKKLHKYPWTAVDAEALEVR